MAIIRVFQNENTILTLSLSSPPKPFSFYTPPSSPPITPSKHLPITIPLFPLLCFFPFSSFLSKFNFFPFSFLFCSLLFYPNLTFFLPRSFFVLFFFIKVFFYLPQDSSSISSYWNIIHIFSSFY